MPLGIMGIQSITNDELLNGAADLLKGCILKQVTPKKYLEISNGENTAEMDAVLYRSDPLFYWKFKTERLRLNHKDSDFFVQGYNKRASELGMTGFYVTIDDMIARFVVLMVLFKACS